MSEQPSKPGEPEQLRQRVLARWENEGGAGARDSQADLAAGDDSRPVPPLTNAELSQLHIRVIALEGLVAALLTEASDRQLALTREMADYISPRPGFTHHALTLRAANQMTQLVDRARRFRDLTSS